MINESEVFSLFDRHCSRIKSGGNNQYLALCPFHDDTRHSFSFNSEGLYNCKGCGESGNAVKFAKLQNENPKPYYSDEYKRTDGKQTGKPIKNGLNGGKSTDTVDKTTVKQRAIDLTPKLKEYEIKYPKNEGYEPFMLNDIGKDKDGAITIPYWEDGKCVGIKHHKPKNGKQSWWEGDGRIKWYNSWVFDEGEKDANRLVYLGYNATSTSGGALSVPPIPDKFKEPKELILLYDNDESGIKGSEKCAEQIYRSSGTLDAFDDKTGEEVEYAINNKVLYQPKPKEGEIQVMSIGQLVKMDYKKPEIIVSNMVQQESVSVFGGCSGTGKSWGVLQMGMCISSGKPVFGHFEVAKPYKVLLCQYELTNGQMKERVQTLMKSFDSDWETIDRNFDYQVFSKEDAFTDRWESLERFLSNSNGKYNGGVVIVDNLYTSVNTETDTSNNAHLIPVVKRMGDICEKYNVSLVVVTHHKKGTKAMVIDIDDCLGGATLTRYASNVFQMKQSKLSTDLRVMEITKVRGEPSDLIEVPFKLRFNPDDGTFEKGEIINKESIHYIEAKDRWEIKLVNDMKNYESSRGSAEWSRADIWGFLSTEEGWEQTQSNETKVTRFISKCVSWGLMSKEGHNAYRIIRTELKDD